MKRHPLWELLSSGLGPLAPIFIRPGVTHAEIQEASLRLVGESLHIPEEIIDILSASCGFGLPQFGSLSFSPFVTLLPVTLWTVYVDVHEIFLQNQDKVPARLVIGENPFGADYGYIVLLRTNVWEVELVTENIPEVVAAGTFSRWIASEALTFEQHVEQLKAWLLDSGETEIDDALGQADSHVRDYLGFMGGSKSGVLLEEWGQRFNEDPNRTSFFAIGMTLTHYPSKLMSLSRFFLSPE
ncbi:hypothetical protein CEUSTIGMA_g11033.t1 [Chlamydomonas eustigma]|uniref:Uncharacterized protein n=1 Tax=Chlamydomonas eustigma TaxID=1157962 RepID=A0A250XL15_9CHLO|nr:hypothetical protein CEUSTIGMA_g11033.t1 [Chlamydomonas eustigma]|eukprot:GAX83609.1 hypothetical protein CEUSTIGMA_g11033.t1 [Chlamydomonas eustigma]